MEDYPKSVTKECTQKILDQMNKTLYEIDERKGIYGFFCYLKKNPVLVMNRYINNEDIKSINISINGKKIELIEMIYKDIDYNISIIKINKNKSINFIEIDNNLYENEPEMYFSNKDSIYIIQCINMNNISVSYGVIYTINKDKLIYRANTNKDSKYSLIFNLSNNKLIGIQNRIDSNNGIFFNSIIIKYEDKHNYFLKIRIMKLI